MKIAREDMIGVPLRRTLGDWVLGGLGATTAAASAGFAAYMGFVGPTNLGQQGGSGFHLLPIVTGVPAAQTAALRGTIELTHQASNDRGALPVPGPGGPIDFAPTGTVSEARQDQKAADPPAKTPAQGSAVALPDFVLRDVFDGKALIESRSALRLVEPGSSLEGAGRVLSIERRGEDWVVTTTQGVISSPAH